MPKAEGASPPKPGPVPMVDLRDEMQWEYVNITNFFMSQHDMLLEFGQRMPDGRGMLVTRIAVTLEHARDIVDRMSGLLAKQAKMKKAMGKTKGK